MADLADSIGHLFALIAGIFLLFFLPILIVTAKMDATSQNLIDNAVVEFVDNARSTAVITDSSFETLVRKIDSAQPNCIIEITHASKYAVLNGTEVETLYRHYGKGEILNTIYTVAGDNQAYKMKNGDYLTVKVYNSSPTLATKLYRMISHNFNPSGVTIYSVYSGYVGNNPQ